MLVLCDPRLVAKSYGKVFLDSLPPLPRSRQIADVQAFFHDSQPGETAPAPAAAQETGMLL